MIRIANSTTFIMDLEHYRRNQWNVGKHAMFDVHIEPFFNK